MKFLAFAPVALALVQRQATGPGDIIAADVNAIIDNVNSLKAAIDDFKGAEQADALVAASVAVVTTLKKATADADASPPLTGEDIAPFLQPLVDLGPVVNGTITTLIGKKQVFADSGRGCEVYPQLVDQQTGTRAFNESLIAKTPEDLLIVAVTIAQPILDSLAAGIAAFKDVECAATTTSSAASSTAPPTGTQTSDAATTTASGTQSTDSASASASVSATATGSGTTAQPTGATTTVVTDVTETVPCTTETGSASPSGVTATVVTEVTETVPCTTGSAAQSTGAACPGCPTTLVASPTHAGNSTGSGGSGSGGNGGNGGSGSSPSTTPVIAGASGKHIPLAVAILGAFALL